METKTVTTTVIKSIEGKVLRYLSDNWIADAEIYLGYIFTSVVENW